MDLVICGACGRMAGEVLRRAHKAEDMTIVGAIDVDTSPNLCKDIGEVLGMGSIGVEVQASSELDALLKTKKPQLIVDFTTAQASVENAIVASRNGVDIVIGTTGISEDQKKKIEESIQKSGGRLILASNFSVCVNVFMKLAGEAAKTLKDYDIEVIEAHHRFKKDAPSGTAKTLAGILLDATGRSEKDLIYGREGLIGERKPNEIAIHSIRAGDIVGDHTVLFSTMGERMEIKHQNHSREALVMGCLRAIRWLPKQKPGVYDMWDVLGLKD
jgi:4-hydroxy-tetrahydrodipicolinate reductase